MRKRGVGVRGESGGVAERDGLCSGRLRVSPRRAKVENCRCEIVCFSRAFVVGFAQSPFLTKRRRRSSCRLRWLKTGKAQKDQITQKKTLVGWIAWGEIASFRL